MSTPSASARSTRAERRSTGTTSAPKSSAQPRVKSKPMAVSTNPWEAIAEDPATIEEEPVTPVAASPAAESSEEDSNPWSDLLEDDPDVAEGAKTPSSVSAGAVTAASAGAVTASTAGAVATSTTGAVAASSARAVAAKPVPARTDIAGGAVCAAGVGTVASGGTLAAASGRKMCRIISMSTDEEVDKLDGDGMIVSAAASTQFDTDFMEDAGERPELPPPSPDPTSGSISAARSPHTIMGVPTDIFMDEEGTPRTPQEAIDMFSSDLHDLSTRLHRVSDDLAMCQMVFSKLAGFINVLAERIAALEAK